MICFGCRWRWTNDCGYADAEYCGSGDTDAKTHGRFVVVLHLTCLEFIFRKCRINADQLQPVHWLQHVLYNEIVLFFPVETMGIASAEAQLVASGSQVLRHVEILFIVLLKSWTIRWSNSCRHFRINGLEYLSSNEEMQESLVISLPDHGTGHIYSYLYEWRSLRSFQKALAFILAGHESTIFRKTIHVSLVNFWRSLFSFPFVLVTSRRRARKHRKTSPNWPQKSVSCLTKLNPTDGPRARCRWKRTIGWNISPTANTSLCLGKLRNLPLTSSTLARRNLAKLWVLIVEWSVQ